MKTEKKHYPMTQLLKITHIGWFPGGANFFYSNAQKDLLMFTAVGLLSWVVLLSLVAAAVSYRWS